MSPPSHPVAYSMETLVGPEFAWNAITLTIYVDPPLADEDGVPDKDILLTRFLFAERDALTHLIKEIHEVQGALPEKLQSAIATYLWYTVVEPMILAHGAESDHVQGVHIELGVHQSHIHSAIGLAITSAEERKLIITPPRPIGTRADDIYPIFGEPPWWTAPSS